MKMAFSTTHNTESERESIHGASTAGVGALKRFNAVEDSVFITIQIYRYFYSCG